MRDYILFIDTETSGMPKKWNEPTGHVHKWPYILQISWIVYHKNGEKIHTHDFYINPGEINIQEDALKIHGITLDFLHEKGITRKEVLQHLANDLLKYQPLVVGHFIQFDLKMMEVAFNRVGISHNLSSLPKFCTMLNTRNTFLENRSPMLRLGDLYYQLFKEKLVNQHNALIDVEATRDCFFELSKRGTLNKEVIENQQKQFKEKRSFKDYLMRFLS